MRATLRWLVAHSPFSPTFMRFALVGATGVVVNNLILFLLHGLAGLLLPIASVVAVESAIVSNFLLNDRWTFRRLQPEVGRFLRFNVVSAGGLLVNVAVLTSLVELFGLHYLIANLAGIGAALAWNFSINVRWTWAPAAEAAETAGAVGTYEKGEAMSEDLVVIPTYNEAQNIKPLVEEILEQGPFDVLVVDDGSPDGTGAIADRMAGQHPHRVRVLHRSGKQGLGSAYRAAFDWALARPYRRIYQMDADWSHAPGTLRELRRKLGEGSDLVLGSRWVRGGGVKGWPFWRLAVSRFGSRYARTILRLRQRDLTGGFKGFRRSVLESIRLEEIRSNGYAFQIETTYRAELAGARVTEIPIVFVDRVRGKSKMGWPIILEAMRVVVGLRLRRPTVDRLREYSS
ncbi:MAG: glycosyltransferase [Actinomycetota bacterium]